MLYTVSCRQCNYVNVKSENKEDVSIIDSARFLNCRLRLENNIKNTDLEDCCKDVNGTEGLRMVSRDNIEE
jgi:hypothetical protein